MGKMSIPSRALIFLCKSLVGLLVVRTSRVAGKTDGHRRDLLYTTNHLIPHNVAYQGVEGESLTKCHICHVSYESVRHVSYEVVRHNVMSNVLDDFVRHVSNDFICIFVWHMSYCPNIRYFCMTHVLRSPMPW